MACGPLWLRGQYRLEGRIQNCSELSAVRSSTCKMSGWLGCFLITFIAYQSPGSALIHCIAWGTEILDGHLPLDFV